MVPGSGPLVASGDRMHKMPWPTENRTSSALLEGRHFIDLGPSIIVVLPYVDLLTLLTVSMWSLVLGLANWLGLHMIIINQMLMIPDFGIYACLMVLYPFIFGFTCLHNEIITTWWGICISWVFSGPTFCPFLKWKTQKS